MPTKKQINQAIFQEALLNLAYKKAAHDAQEENGLVGYDFRGRAVYDLELTDEDCQGILKKFSPPSEEKKHADDEPVASQASVRKVLAQLTGINFTGKIRCHLDLTDKVQDKSGSDYTGLKHHMKHLIEHASVGIPLSDPQKMSIIPIYEELLCNIEHNNAAVKNRMKLAFKVKWPVGLDIALGDAFRVAKEALQVELNELTQSDKFIGKNPGEINKILDKERARLQQVLKEKWFNVFLEGLKSQPKLSNQERKDILSKLTDEAFKKIYEETPAHQYDILGSDFVGGTLTYITNSGGRTAHNKHEWKKDGRGASAFRFLIRSALSMEGGVTPRPGGEMSARVPSIADVTAEKEDDIRRIAAVYKQFHVEFKQFADKESVELKAEDKESSNSIVYNLLTSLDPYLEEQRDKKNRQNESARRILAGAHLYNKGAKQGKYVWVQNISVNRHSVNLGEFFALSVHKEATLMADIALLYTLQDNLKGNVKLKSVYKEVLAEYKQFLDTPGNLGYFYKSTEGKKASNLIKACKQAISDDELEILKDASLVQKANLILLKLYHKNYHYDKKYGNLVQALSIFVEKRSIAGCKSANERHEDVQKRTGVLIGFEGHNNTAATSLDRILTEFLNEPKTKPDQLDKIVARLVNLQRMYGDEAAVSPSDQGGPSKLQLLATSFARGVWNTGKALFGLATASSIGIGATIIGLTAVGLAFPPLNIALAIYASGLGFGFAALYVPKLWNAAKLWLGVSSLGLVAAVGFLAATSIVAFPPLGMALAISLGVVGLGISTSVIGGIGLKAINTNHGCSPEMTYCINSHASDLQSSKSVKLISRAAESAIKKLDAEDDAPRSAKHMSKLGRGATFRPELGRRARAVKEGGHEMVARKGINHRKPVQSEEDFSCQAGPAADSYASEDSDDGQVRYGRYFARKRARQEQDDQVSRIDKRFE